MLKIFRNFSHHGKKFKIRLSLKTLLNVINDKSPNGGESTLEKV